MGSVPDPNSKIKSCNELCNRHATIVQVCTCWEHATHATLALSEDMDRQKQVLATLLDGVDGYLDTLKRDLATVRELANDERSNYRFSDQANIYKSLFVNM